MRLVLAAAILFTLAGCSHGDAQLQQRVAYWKGALSRDVPPGTRADTAMAWGVAHGVRFTYYDQQRWLYANAERVPVSGFKFPCSEWNIILTIPIDSDGRSLPYKIDTVGSCI